MSIVIGRQWTVFRCRDFYCACWSGLNQLSSCWKSEFVPLFIRAVFTLFILGPCSVYAQVTPADTWEYTWNGGVYDSLAEAEIDMRSGPEPRPRLIRSPQTIDDWLINLARQSSNSTTPAIRFGYYAAEPPMFSEEPYHFSAISTFIDGGVATESLAILEKLEQIDSIYPNNGCAYQVLSLGSAWEYSGWGTFGGNIPPNRTEEKFKKEIRVGYAKFENGMCTDEIAFFHDSHIWRGRYFQCPAGTGYEIGEGIHICFSCNNGPPGLVFCEVELEDEITAKLVPSDCNTVGNPCTVVAGVKVESQTDYSAPGISFNRSYDSSTQGFTTSGLGLGWTHQYAGMLPHSSPVESSITLYGQDGGYVPLVDQGNGVFGSSTGQPRSISNVGSGCEYTVKSPNGDSQTFERSVCGNNGRLKYLTNSAGQRTSLTYESQNPLPLDTAVGPFGHTLSFEYDYIDQIQQDRLRRVTDPAGTHYIYDYDDQGRLVSVEYPDNTLKTFLYENSLYPNHLTGMLDEIGQRFSTYAYDDVGRTLSSEHAGGVGAVGLEWLSPLQTEVTYSNGLTTHYSHDDVGELEIRKPTSISDVYGTKVTSHEQDGRGRVTSQTNERGVTTNYAYDAINRIGTTEAQGLPLERTTESSFDQPSGKINLIRAPSVFQSAAQIKEIE